jgi:type I restriction enzyme S subunit
MNTGKTARQVPETLDGRGFNKTITLHEGFLDTLPKSWTFDRLKDVVSLRNEKSSEASEAEDYLELEDLESGTGRILNRQNTLEVESAVTLFKKGDVLFGKLRPYLEKYYLAKFDGKCTGEILAFNPEKVSGNFLRYCIGSRWFIERCNTLAYGAKMPRVNWTTQLAYFNIPLPPPTEQERIAAFLDASCAAIDAAVAAKQRQIETLDSIVHATLHKAFANDEWPQERIKDVAVKIGSGVTPEGGAANYLNEGIPLLRSQNIHFDGLHLDDVAFISEETHAEMSNSQIKPRDVLLNITGASIGRCTYVPKDFGAGNVNQHVCFIRGNHQIDYRFLSSFLSSPIGQGQVLSSFTGASRQGLSHIELGLISVPLPSIDVQRTIIADSERRMLQQKQIRRNMESQITTLTAFRKSLIHECVTGQRRISESDLKKVKAYG